MGELWDAQEDVKFPEPDLGSDFDAGSFVEVVKEQIQMVADAANSVAEQYRESADNIESGFGHPTYQSEELAGKADELESWASELESWEPSQDGPDRVRRRAHGRRGVGAPGRGHPGVGVRRHRRGRRHQRLPRLGPSPRIARRWHTAPENVSPGPSSFLVAARVPALYPERVPPFDFRVPRVVQHPARRPRRPAHR